MFNCEVREDSGIKWIHVRGRIDSLNAPHLQREVTGLIGSGERVLVVDLNETNYISSAGLRVFMDAYRRLKKAGGEIIFYQVPPIVRNVFEMSSLTEIFHLVAGREEIEAVLHGQQPSVPLVSAAIEGISIEYLERPTSTGELIIFGAQDRLVTAAYSERDVVTVSSDAIRFGTGLATLGERYEDYRNFFGEALTVQGDFFFYPAVSRPAVDFMLCSRGGAKFDYRYLHGFGFNGDYRYVLSFAGTDGFVELSRLLGALLQISSANLLGVVFLAESKGFWGMHLKRVPIVENRPTNGKEIFARENFTDWVNFPVEPGEIGNIIVGAGIVVRDKARESADVQKLVAEGKNFHIHAGVFAKEPLGRKIDSFEEELRRVVSELPVHKVQHALGQSRFSMGMAGIIELRG